MTYSEATSQYQECNSQATAPGCYLPVPEFDAVVARSHLVQKGQNQVSCCLIPYGKYILYEFCYNCEQEQKQKIPTHVGESSVMLSRRENLFWIAPQSGHGGGLFAGAASPFLLSHPSLSFFSLFPPLLSPFCFQKLVWETTRQGNSHVDNTRGI